MAPLAVKTALLPVQTTVLPEVVNVGIGFTIIAFVVVALHPLVLVPVIV